jgi:nucleoside-diphosphate-sugar epimerase
MAFAMNKTAYLISLPLGFLWFVAKVLGKSDALQRLCGNLQVDISKTKSMLDWKPPISLNEGLRRAVSK